MKLFIGSQNQDKIKEIKQLLEGLNIELITAETFPTLPEVEEDAETIEGNAIKKANAYADFTSLPTIADDTGFFVDALDGNPGVKAARYAGENCSYQDNRNKLLVELKEKSDRNAHFRTIVAFVSKRSEPVLFEGKVEGIITKDEKGDKGFGYDPLFYVPSFHKTFAEMNDTEKNAISHRGIALQKCKKYLETICKED